VFLMSELPLYITFPSPPHVQLPPIPHNPRTIQTRKRFAMHTPTESREQLLYNRQMLKGKQLLYRPNHVGGQSSCFTDRITSRTTA